MTEREFLEYAASVEPAYMQAVKEAEARQAKLAKPPHSLGKLEEISVKIAGITGRVLNRIDKCRVLVFAADNGVVCEGVAVTPQSVTLKQCINMTMHKTGMSALAKYFGNSVRIYDVGINSAFAHPGIADRKVRFGTGNIRRGPAMSREECIKAICAGIEAAETAAADGVDAVGIGEMGIGNTTSSAAVLASLLGIEPDLVTGRGSGLTDEAYELKKKVVSEAIKLNAPNKEDAIDVLSKVGGLDIAAMAGAYIGLAKMRIPAVADGFISIVAALAAVKLCSNVRDFLFLSHASTEPGYVAAAKELRLEPFLALDMHLGEGSGCPLAFEVIKAANAVMSEMATFDEASIDDGYLEKIRSGR